MIKYALVCDKDHTFEGWFGASADYDDQSERGLVECPVCSSRGVRKQIMAPARAGTGKRDAPNDQARSMMMEVMGRMRAHVEDNFDYVGDRFAAWRRAAGLPEELSVRCLRHSYVSHLIEDGVDPLFVQQQVGHSWASATATR